MRSRSSPPPPLAHTNTSACTALDLATARQSALCKISLATDTRAMRSCTCLQDAAARPCLWHTPALLPAQQGCTESCTCRIPSCVYMYTRHRHQGHAVLIRPPQPLAHTSACACTTRLHWVLYLQNTQLCLYVHSPQTPGPCGPDQATTASGAHQRFCLYNKAALGPLLAEYPAVYRFTPQKDTRAMRSPSRPPPLLAHTSTSACMGRVIAHASTAAPRLLDLGSRLH